MPQFPSPQPRGSQCFQRALREAAGGGINREHLEGPCRLVSPRCWSEVTPQPLLPLRWTSRTSPPSLSPSAPLGPAPSLPCSYYLMSLVSTPSLPDGAGTACGQRQDLIFLGLSRSANSKPDIPRTSVELAPENTPCPFQNHLSSLPLINWQYELYPVLKNIIFWRQDPGPAVNNEVGFLFTGMWGPGRRLWVSCEWR